MTSRKPPARGNSQKDKARRRPWAHDGPFLRMCLSFCVAQLVCMGSTVNAVAAAKINVVASLPSLAAIAKEVGGDRVNVTAMASATEDPHFVDAKPSLLVAMSRADLLVANGLELEIGWLPTLLVSARNGRIQPGGPGYFEAAPLVSLLEVPSVRLDRAMGDLHPGGNPHFLNEPGRVVDIGRGLALRFAELDPEHASAYAEKGEAFAKRLTVLRNQWVAKFSGVDTKHRQVVTYHRSMAYFLDWLGLVTAATLEPRPGVPPHPAHVAFVLNTMRARGIAAIVQEEYYPKNTGTTLAQLAHVPLVIVHGAVRFDVGQSFSDHLGHMAQSVFDAMAAKTITPVQAPSSP